MSAPTRGVDEGAVILTSSTGFLGLELRRQIRQRGLTVHRPGPDEDLDELARRVRPRVIVHCGVGALDEVSDELAPSTHLLEEVLEVAGRWAVPRLLVADSLSSPTRANTPRRRSNVTFLRLGAVYGPGQDDRQALVPRVIDEFLSGATPALDSGTALYDWVCIDDVVSAFLLAADHDRPGAVVDVGRGRVSSVSDIVTTLATMTGHPLPVRFGTRPDAFPSGRAAVANRAASDRLCWQPSVHPPRGLDLIVTWRRARRSTATGQQLEVPSSG